MTQEVSKYLGKLGDSGIPFFTGKCYFTPLSFQCPHRQILMDHKAGYQNLGKHFFLGKQWDQNEKKVKSHSKKLYEILHQMKGKFRRHKNSHTYKNRH